MGLRGQITSELMKLADGIWDWGNANARMTKQVDDKKAMVRTIFSLMGKERKGVQSTGKAQKK